MAESVRIGGGSAYLNDRLDAAIALAKGGRLDAMVMDMLAERTLAIMQAAKRAGGVGYAPTLPERAAALVPVLAGAPLVTNGGSADPPAAARAVAERLPGVPVAAVTGDDVAAVLREIDPVLLETGERLSRLPEPPVSANAYLGADGLVAALGEGARVVVAGRVTDSALALAVARHHLGWAAADWGRIAAGLLAGHILECSGHATGGYFAGPGPKAVPGLDDLGFPIAEITADGDITITRPPGTGGRIDRHTITEQILYEMHDPAAYVTPDGVLDVTAVTLAEAPEAVTIRGARGHPRPDTLKTLVAVDGGVIAEAEISYCGIDARERAVLAGEVAGRRLDRLGFANLPRRIDVIGLNALWPLDGPAPMEARLRVAGRLPDRAAGERFVTEVETLYTNGPAGGGGVRLHIRPCLRTLTAFIPRDAARPAVTMVRL